MTVLGGCNDVRARADTTGLLLFDNMGRVYFFSTKHVRALPRPILTVVEEAMIIYLLVICEMCDFSTKSYRLQGKLQSFSLGTPHGYVRGGVFKYLIEVINGVGDGRTTASD